MNIAPSDPPVTPFPSADIPHALTQIGRLGEAVRAEFDLVSARMTWLVLASAFIFAAFTTVTAQYRANHELADILLYVMWWAPCIGIVLAFTVFRAILAAHSAMTDLKEQRDHMMARLPPHLRITLVSSQSGWHRRGNIPPFVIPPLLLLVWVGALVLLGRLALQGKLG